LRPYLIRLPNSRLWSVWTSPELEHVQVDVPIKRIALLDDVSHHLRFQALTDQMSDSEKGTLQKVLQDIGAKGLADLRLKRDIKRDNYAYVVA